MRPLAEVLSGTKRLFVCGLALDFCVLDTCINAKVSGFDSVILILDAARAAHIPGVGGFGTGFLQDPSAIKSKILKAEVRLGSFRSLVEKQAR
eukprot:3153521-Prymnesium_polylepis.1